MSWVTSFIFGTRGTATLDDSSVLRRRVLDFVFYNAPLAQLLLLLVFRDLPVHLGIRHVLGQDVADKGLGDEEYVLKNNSCPVISTTHKHCR